MIENINPKRIKEGLVSRKDAAQYCLERRLELKAIIAKYHDKSSEDCQKEIKKWWVSYLMQKVAVKYLLK